MSDVALPSAARFASDGPEHCIIRRNDGVHADPEALGTTLIAAVDNILRSGHYLAGLDYPVLIGAVWPRPRVAARCRWPGAGADCR